MSTENFESLVQQAQGEARDPSLKAYFPLWVLLSRRLNDPITDGPDTFALVENRDK
jgi:hypothetical protein